MYRDSAHRNNWLSHEECSDLHTGAIISEWLHLRLEPSTIRLGLFMSLRDTWVGQLRDNHDYPQHVLVAAAYTRYGLCPETPWESKAKIAKVFGVDASTLRRRCRGVSQPRSKARQKQQLLTAGEEEAVVDWCKRMSDFFFPVTMLMLISMAVAIL